MKIIIALAIAVIATWVMQSGITGWTIVRNAPEEVAADPVEPSPTPRRGDWMRDPGYRTALERNTIHGEPKRVGGDNPE